MTTQATRRRQWVAAGLIVVAVAAVAGLIGGLWSSSASSMNTSAAAQDKTDQSKDGPQPVDTLATGAVVVPKSKNEITAEASPSIPKAESGGLTFSSPDASSSSSIFPSAFTNLFSKQETKVNPAGFGMSNIMGLKTCFPTTGEEVTEAVYGDDCTVIVLMNGNAEGKDYKIEKELNVTSHKIFLGNPIDLPKLNATKKIRRLFNVMPGGKLELRSVCLYKGSGESLGALGGGRKLQSGLGIGKTKLTMGPAVYVHLGGVFRGSGVVFRSMRGTLEGFLKTLQEPLEARRTFGGHVFVAGGQFLCYGCFFIGVNPYGNPDENQITVGGNVLVITGAMRCIGCYNIGFNLFTSGINAGGNTACLGGASTWIGGGNSGATLAQGQFGIGQNNFVGGGVLVLVGYQDISVLLAIVRAGMGQQTCGGGVLILIGHCEDRAWATGIVFNAGQTYSVGGGVLQLNGGEIMNFQTSAGQIVSGGSCFNGGGDVGYIGMAYGTFGNTFNQHGLGMRWCQNAGTLENILINGWSTAIARAQFILGSESYLGTGFFSSINQTRHSYQVVNGAWGGHEYWVGPGAAAFIKTYSFSKRVINYRTNPYAWVVAGTMIAGSYKPTNTTPKVVTNRGDNIFVNKTGVFYVSKDGLVLLPPVKPPTKQAEKDLRKFNITPPHQGVARDDLPHGIFGPIGPGNSGGTGDRYKAASVGDVSPSPSPVMVRRLEEGGEKRSLNQMLVVDSHIETQKVKPLDSKLFHRHLTHQVQKKKSRRLGAFSRTSGMKPLLAAFASPQDLMNAYQGATEEQEQKEKEYWPEYIYAKKRDTKCFLCGVSPLPTSQHINPNDDPIDAQWWLNANETQVVDRRALMATSTDPAGAVRQTALSSAGQSNACLASDECVNADTPFNALAKAEKVAPEDGLPSLPPAVKTMRIMERRGRRLWAERRRLHEEENTELIEDDWLGGSANPVKLPDNQLFWKKVTVHCPPREGDSEPPKRCGLKDKDIKRALKEYIDTVAGVVLGEDPDYKLSAAYGETPEAVHEALDVDYLASMVPRKLSDACPYAATIKLFVLTRDDDTYAALFKLFEDLANDPKTLTEILTTEDARLCPASATMEGEGVVTLPSVDTTSGIKFYQDWHFMGGKDKEEEAERRQLLAQLGMGDLEKEKQWASVSLFSSYDLAPVILVEEGETYSIVLQGLDTSVDDVVVELVQGLARGGEVIATAKKSAGGGEKEDAPWTLDWTAAGLAAMEEDRRFGSSYFLYAHYKTYPGFFAFSTPFRVLI